MPTMNVSKMRELDDATERLLQYLRGKIDVNVAANFIDASAVVLDPECADNIFGPLQLGRMPDSSVGANAFEVGLSPLDNLQWCLAEFVFSIPGSESNLVGEEGFYLWFCHWYCKHWTSDDALEALVATVAAVIELDDETLIGMVAKYLHLTLDLTSEDKQLDCGGLRVALRVLNASISLRTAPLSNSERTCVIEGVLNDALQPELRVAWAEVVRGLAKI